ncbi:MULTISPECIES: hypothetical protein [unclassified Meridianimarinicoccus]|uniref:hypothetical protein n=1 Tax=unclassified Meridianimarinicoccus TaxID=2923344 RepID=UPI001867331C|nr:hypothetical protein [Fluviibacterium sp. MJW13]
MSGKLAASGRQAIYAAVQIDDLRENVFHRDPVQENWTQYPGAAIFVQRGIDTKKPRAPRRAGLDVCLTDQDYSASSLVASSPVS